MNEETINMRLESIEKKLDDVAELITQTSLQEYRITAIEKRLSEIANQRDAVMWRWLTPIISAFVSAAAAFIISGGFGGN